MSNSNNKEINKSQNSKDDIKEKNIKKEICKVKCGGKCGKCCPELKRTDGKTQTETICRLGRVGGQAVLEGVMMKGRESYAIAVRKENGDIVKSPKPITIRNLFTMTAGFNYNFNVPAIKKAGELA